MNKQEKLIVAVLFAVLIGSMLHQNRMAQQRAEEAQRVAEETRDRVPEAPDIRGLDPETDAGLNVEEDVARTTPPSDPLPVQRWLDPEETVVLRNDNARLAVTSHGGGIRAAELLDYPRTLRSEPGDVVVLDFASRPALALEGAHGEGLLGEYSLQSIDAGRGVLMRTELPNGLQLERHLVLTNGYRVAVVDRWTNPAGQPLELDARRIVLGSMQRQQDDDDASLAVDLRVETDRRPDYAELSKSALAALFGGTGGGGCSAARTPPNAPRNAETWQDASIRWGAVRNRFFVQVLTPETLAVGAAVRAARAMDVPIGTFQLERVGVALGTPPETVDAGTTFEQRYEYYVGPRKLSQLRAMGEGQSRIMRFGMWRVFCEWLLGLLNVLHRVVPNYGVAIMLLTGLVRLTLLPVTRRSAEGMRRMQALSPQLQELKALYKDDPQKQQQETLRLYRENKVNPLSSCLPMFIQLPVFIALFSVLRSAVELRFAPFLWVADLSAPENLLAETLGFGINVFPFLMAGTMALQSYLTPTAGDASQQRMMMVLMPIMMLVMLYNFPAALGLYWTTSQVLAICGLLWVRRKRARDAGPGTDGMEVISPPRETRQMRRANQR